MSERVRKAAEVRRAELLSAATGVLRARGVDATTVDDITSAAGVSKGSFYLHFRSKDELLDALRMQLAEQVGAEVAALPRPRRRSDWPRFTASVVRTAIEAQVRVEDLHDLLMHAPHRHASGDSDSGSAHDPASNVLAALVAAGIEAGAYRVTDPAATATLLYEVLHAAGTWACDAPRESERIIAATGELLQRALAG